MSWISKSTNYHFRKVMKILFPTLYLLLFLALIIIVSFPPLLYEIVEKNTAVAQSFVKYGFINHPDKYFLYRGTRDVEVDVADSAKYDRDSLYVSREIVVTHFVDPIHLDSKRTSQQIVHNSGNPFGVTKSAFDYSVISYWNHQRSREMVYSGPLGQGYWAGKCIIKLKKYDTYTISRNWELLKIELIVFMFALSGIIIFHRRYTIGIFLPKIFYGESKKIRIHLLISSIVALCAITILLYPPYTMTRVKYSQQELRIRNITQREYYNSISLFNKYDWLLRDEVDLVNGIEYRATLNREKLFLQFVVLFVCWGFGMYLFVSYNRNKNKVLEYKK